MEHKIYNQYSAYLTEKYGQKVYKLPINLPVTCPNRDGVVGTHGCTFCGAKGAGHESLDSDTGVKEQLLKNKTYIAKRYGAKKFIAYFQNFTNTYMPFDDFKFYIDQSLIEDIVEIAVSTRPDCLTERHLDYLKHIEENYDLNISIELGLQTVNYHSLEKINRGHGLSEYIGAVLDIKKYGFDICTHLILNLPWDTMLDVKESAKIISTLGTKQVKLHSLYIVKGTKMAEQYLTKSFEMISLDEYKERVKVFLEHLEPNMVIQRLIARAPEDETLFSNWGTSWWKIRDDIVTEMIEENRFQGRLYKQNQQMLRDKMQ